MSTIEYYDLSVQRPDLQLPPFSHLLSESKEKVRNMTQDQLITYRTARLLSRDVGAIDSLAYYDDTGINKKQV